MLTDAGLILALAALLGLLLAALHAGRPGRVPWSLGALHGGLGAAGTALLLLSLGGPARGAATGTAGFGRVAAWALLAALLLGASAVVARLRRRPIPVLLIGLHATVAMMALAVLAAYVALPA